MLGYEFFLGVCFFFCVNMPFAVVVVVVVVVVTVVVAGTIGAMLALTWCGRSHTCLYIYIYFFLFCFFSC